MFQRLAVLVAGIAAVSTVSPSAWAGDGDGCYQTAGQGALYGVLCISGSEEEGIAGANATIAIMGPNGGNVEYCTKTAQISIEAAGIVRTTTYMLQDGSVIVMKGTTYSTGQHEGEITFDRLSKKSYTKLQDEHAAPLLKKALESELCSSL